MEIKKFKQKLEDIIDFISNYSRQNLGTPLFSHDLSGETFKIKIPSRYSNFSTTFFNAKKEVISYGDLKDKCRIKILMKQVVFGLIQDVLHFIFTQKKY